MRPWITQTVTELSGVEDDIVIEYTMELLENPENPVSLETRPSSDSTVLLGWR
jgi:hypothetical protein